MSENKYQRVYSVNGALQAIFVRSMLEKAGIPASVAHAKGPHYLDVLVPAARVEEASLLLHPEQCYAAL
jgi:hypothetical protein